MINKEIIINKKTREIINGENGDLFRLGVDGENLQENIVFKFEDEFVNGTARIEITMQDNTKSYVMINKVNQTYVLPVKSILTKTGLNKMQLVITQGTNDNEIPIFKSKMFSFYIADSINADTEQPEEYPQWIDKANTTLNEIDNFDIDAIKELNEATITITDRYGETKSVQVFDGENGQDGKDAKINGVNTLRLLAGKNISLEQEDDELTISAEGGSGGGAVNSVNGMTGDVIIEIPDVSDFITKDVNNLTNYEPKATTGNNIVASIDSSTYIMTITLRNSNNETLNSQTIDLPLETMVVNGSYDDTTKKIILTLKNGNTIEFSIADLVSGLQSEITSNNKLNADYIDDSLSTNKFQHIGELAEIKDTIGYVDFKKAKKGIYIPNLSYESTQFISSVLNNTIHTAFQLNYVCIYITKEITDMEQAPSQKTYFGYMQGLDTSTGEIVYVNLYVGTNGVIGQEKKQPVNWPKAFYITNQEQEIIGLKKYITIPQVSSYTAPTNEKELVAKKYVDDNIGKYSTMPTASSTYLDKIVQFVGTTDTYTDGYFYKCVVDNNIYSWEQVNVQPSGESGGTSIIYEENSLSNRFDLDNATKGFYIFYSNYNAFCYKTGTTQNTISNYTPLCLIYNKEFYNAEINDELGTMICLRNNNTTYNGILHAFPIKKSSQTAIEYGTGSYLIKNEGRFLVSQAQVISGEKTFNTIPKVSSYTAPTQDTQLTAKKYVDDQISAQIGNINTILATLTTPSASE